MVKKRVDPRELILTKQCSPTGQPFVVMLLPHHSNISYVDSSVYATGRAIYDPAADAGTIRIFR